MRHGNGEFIGHDGMELYYRMWHPDVPAKASLIIVHGLGEHGGRYMNLVHGLVPQGYSVYTIDNRGHGQSPGQRGHVRRFAEFREDIACFVQHLSPTPIPDGRLFLMGHSLGGLVVLDAVLNGMPGLGGVILSAPAMDSGAISPALMAISKILSRVWPTLSIKTGLDVSGISRDPEVLTAYRQDSLVHGLGTPRLAMEASTTMSWCFEHVNRLEVPILMMHGTSDRITSPTRSREFFDRLSFADKTYITYEGGYHSSHNDLHYEQVVNDVLGWLDDHLEH